MVRSFASIGHAERGVEARAVLRHHQRNLELVEPLRRHRQANQPAAVARHEVDRLGRDLLRGDRQIAFVLAILIVDDDDHLAGAEWPRWRPRCGRTASLRALFAILSLLARLFALVRLAVNVLTSPGRTLSSVSRPAPRRARRTCRPCRIRGSRVRARRCGRRFVCSIVYGTTMTSKRSIAEAGDGEADAVDRDRSLVHDVTAPACGGKLTVSQWNSASAAISSTWPTASTCPWTKCPPKRPSARSGRSRFTTAAALRACRAS